MKEYTDLRRVYLQSDCRIVLLIFQSVGFTGPVRFAAAKDPTPRSGEEGTNGEKRLHSPFLNSFPLSSNSLTQCAKACISITFFLPSLPRQSQKDDSVFLHIQSCCCFNMVVLQGSAKRRSPGLVNFVPAVTDHFCMAQPSAFTQPGDRLLAEPCLCYGLMNASLIVPRWLFFLARRREGRISGSLHVARRGTRGR